MANAVELADHTGAKITVDNPLPVTMVSGGGSAQDVNVTNSSLAVTGPVTNAQLTAVTGAASAAAWDGVAASATMIAILKAMHAQLVIIAANTDPTP